MGENTGGAHKLSMFVCYILRGAILIRVLAFQAVILFHKDTSGDLFVHLLAPFALQKQIFSESKEVMTASVGVLFEMNRTNDY